MYRIRNIKVYVGDIAVSFTTSFATVVEIATVTNPADVMNIYTMIWVTERTGNTCFTLNILLLIEKVKFT